MAQLDDQVSTYRVRVGRQSDERRGGRLSAKDQLKLMRSEIEKLSLTDSVETTLEIRPQSPGGLMERIAHNSQVIQLEKQLSNEREELRQIKQLLNVENARNAKANTDIRELQQTTHSLEDQLTKTKEDLKRSKQLVTSLEEAKLSLTRQLTIRQADVKRLSQQIIDLGKDNEGRLGTAMFEFKKLEMRFNSNNEQTIQRWKFKVEELELSVSNLQSENDSLKSNSASMSGRLQRMQQQLQQSRKSNNQLMDRLRQQENQLSRLKMQEQAAPVLTRVSSQNDQQAYLSMKQRYLEKCQEVESLKLSSGSQQLLFQLRSDKSLLENELQRMKLDVARLTKELKSVCQSQREKEEHILELQGRRLRVDNFELVESLEAKCKQLLEQQARMTDDYELTIMKLQNQVEEYKETVKSLESNGSTQLRPAADHTFDTALKSHLSDNEVLRNTVKSKNQEIIQLKGQLDEARRHIESMEAQASIDQLKLTAAEKSTKSHYETTIENHRNQADALRRKLQSLQNKLDMFRSELKRKDQFIQQALIARLDRNDHGSQLEYLRSKLKLFSDS